MKLTNGTHHPSGPSVDGNVRLDPQPLHAARMVQLALVAVIVAAAFLIGPVNRNGPQESVLPNQDVRVAAFADAAAAALASLDGGQLGTGFEGTDRGRLFERGSPNYAERSIAEGLLELDLLDASEAAELQANRIQLLAVQCQDRVGVLVTSDVEVPAERRAWWDDNACDTGLVSFLTWPVYIALGDIVGGAS